MRKTVYLLIVMICLTLTGCKKLVKRFGKEASQDITTKVSKESLEELAEKGAKETGSKYVGKSLGNQIVKKAAREKVEKEMEKEGLKSFLQYGTHKASREVSDAGISMSKANILKGANGISYQKRLMGLRAANRHQLAQFSMNLKGKPYAALYKNISVNSYKKGEEALDLLRKENHQIYESVMKMMEPGKPFANKQHYLKYFECAKGKNGELLVYNSDPTAMNSAILVKGNTIRAISGSPNLKKGEKGCGATNFFLDVPLPNKRYIVDGTEYRTDKLGRVVAGTKTYTPGMSYNIKSKLDQKRRKLVMEYKDGRGSEKDDAGHIFQHNMGGVNEGINLVPMDGKFQRGGAWRRLEVEEENLIASALAKGKKVTSERHLMYSGNSKRPSGIRIIVKINGKKALDKALKCP